MSSATETNAPSQPRSIDEIRTEVETSVAQLAGERAERRVRFALVQPTPQLCIVAWIDLLGFSEQIRNADTPAKFQAAYRRMREVQNEFDLDSASVHPDQGDLNASLGKRIIALSDGLVIALNLENDCLAAEVSSYYERVGSFLESLRLAQARCASAGNLVRGGVAVGYFWFEDNILLSPALVEAYNMETKLAQNPVIILRRELAEHMRTLKADEGNSDDNDPMEDLFRDCEWMTEPIRTEHVMLNFMPMFLEDDDAAPFLRSYHQHLIEGRQAAPEPARTKYDWLMQYARDFVRTELPGLEDSIFGPCTAAIAPDTINDLATPPAED